MQFETLYSIAAYFAVMLAIGLFSYKQASEDTEGYLLGGRKLGPKVTALSAGASDMSGWMLMGLPGAVFLSGLSANWIAFGLILGAWFNYLLVAPRLRSFTEAANNAITIPDYFAQRFSDDKNHLKLISSIIIVVFFTLYTSSGMVAGGKLFESAFGLDYQLGMWVTTAVVVAYTLLGGFTAVSITDFVQGCIIMIALVIVPIVIVSHLGSEFSWEMVSHSGLDNIWVDAATGESLTLLGVISLLAWGLGYFGQPHIIVRFMAISSVEALKPARQIGMSWMIISLVGTVSMGLLGAILFTQQGITLDDPETIFIYLSQSLFPPFVGGFFLAAILAAIMSTISSQLLVTSSSLSRDLYQTWFHKNVAEKQVVLVSRFCVIAVALVAAWLASAQDSSILSLVSNAWAGFGAAFGPVVIFSLFWRDMTLKGAIFGMLSGAITVIAWISLPVDIGGQTLSDTMYEIVPGFIIASIAIYLVSKSEHNSKPSSKKMFDVCLKVYNQQR